MNTIILVYNEIIKKKYLSQVMFVLLFWCMYFINIYLYNSLYYKYTNNINLCVCCIYIHTCKLKCKMFQTVITSLPTVGLFFIVV